jgi:SAM-dependent methyltransferase
MLIQRLRQTLQSVGLTPDSLSPADLAPIDSMHLRGREATCEILELVRPQPGDRVLDVGGGLGGTARLLAREYGCPVDVLDLDAEHCDAGQRLTEWVRLDDRVRFFHGNAIRMPFRSGRYDLVLSEHATMSVEDGDALLAEVARVLRVGGRYAFHEVFAGSGPVRYPVPWAGSEEGSHLRTLAEFESLLGRHLPGGLIVRDTTAATLTWIERRAERAASEPTPVLGLHLLFGEDWPSMMANLLHNLRQGRITVAMGVAAR